MALGSYESEVGRGSVLNALAHPTVANPAAAIGAAAQTANAIQQFRTNQFNLQQAQLAPVGQAMRMLMAQTQNPTEDQFNAALGNAARNGGNIDSTVANYADWKANNPGGKLTDFIRGPGLMGISPEKQADLVGTQRMNFNMPQGTYYGTTPGTWAPNAGQFNTAGFVPAGITPETAVGTTAIPDTNKTLPDGSPNPNFMRPTLVTTGDLLRSRGIDPNNPSGGPPGAVAPPAGTSPLGTGRLPAALQNPNNPASSAAPQAPGVRPLVTMPSPGDTALAAAAPAQFQHEIDVGNAQQQQQATLGNILADTAQFNTGPVAGIVGKVRSYANAFGLPVNTDAQSAKESFNKLAAGLANSQGAGSDARMNVNISANPHEELTPAGVDLVTRQLQGNADYLQARAKLAQEFPNRTDYGGYQAKAAQLDPRVFQLTRMTDPQRATYWNSLDSAAKAQLGAAIKKAKDLGVLGG